MLRSEHARRFPWLLMATAMALVALGVVGIYSAVSGDLDARPFYQTLWGKQILWIGVALLVFLAALVPSYTRLAQLSYWLYGVSLAILIVLAAMRAMRLELRPFIYPTNNAYSWIHLPGISFQPSELTKIAFIMALAFYLRYRKNYRTFRGLVPPFLMALVPTGLVLYQPDLGTAMLFLPVLFLMLFAAGARGKHLLAIVLMGLAMVPLFYSSMRGYQRLRIDSWLLQPCAERLHFALREAEAEAEARAAEEQPGVVAPLRQVTIPPEERARLVRQITGMWQFRIWRFATHFIWNEEEAGKAAKFAGARRLLLDALRQKDDAAAFTQLRQFFGLLLADPGHHLWQAKIAVGSGGLWGRGWLEGTQTRAGRLPEAHADSLYAVIAEEFGFWGAGGVVLLYLALFVFGIDVSFSTTEPYGKLVVVGVVALFAAQSFLNMAMSIGLMPITGIPLPLMSYGGSSLVSSFLALGLLCNVAIRRLFLIAPRPFEWRE